MCKACVICGGNKISEVRESMNEKLENLYDLLFDYLKYVTENRMSPAEVESVPGVARVLIDLIILQSTM